MNNICRTAQALVVALLLTLSAFASSPEHLVGGTVPAPAASDRYAPAAASDGADFFVVWSDDRASTGAVIGTRVTREGRILDPLGIRIAEVPGRADEPQVVWDGEAYLVVWGAVERDLTNLGIFAARVAPDGTIVMPPRRILEEGLLDPGRYLASNGTVSVIASYLSDLQIVVLDRQGNPVHRETIASGNVRGPAVAAGTSRFVVTWKANPGYDRQNDIVKAVSLTSSGHVTGDPVTVGHGEHPAIATDGTRFTIAYEKNQDWQQFVLHSRTLDRDLNPVGAERSLLTSRQIEDAQILWLGSHYEVTAVQHSTSGGDEIVSIRVDSNGNPQQPVRPRGAKLAYTYWQRVSNATNGSDVLIARTGYGPPQVGLQIYAQLHPNNAPAAKGGPMLLSWSGNAHRDPVIAASPSSYAAAWVENDGAYFTRVDGNGNSLHGRGIRLSTFYYAVIRVAFDGTNYVVAWRDDEFIGVRYISPANGATVAELHVPVMGWVNLALATTPDATYLAYADTQVRVVRIPSATHTADPVPLAVSPDEMSVDHPALAWNGSDLLVTWTEEYLYPRADPPLVVSVNVYGARVTAGLSLLDPAPLHIAQSTEEERADFDPPSVASNGTDWLVVTSRNSENVIARRVLASGTLEGNEPESFGEGFAPAVAWDGIRYAVTWKEGLFRSYEYEREHPLVLAAVPGSGPLTATNRTSVARLPVTSAPSIAPAGLGQSAIIYTRTSFLPQHAGVQRSFFRMMDFTERRARAVRR
jgi:hypothetical protein